MKPFADLLDALCRQHNICSCADMDRLQAIRPKSEDDPFLKHLEQFPHGRVAEVCEYWGTDRAFSIEIYPNAANPSQIFFRIYISRMARVAQVRTVHTEKLLIQPGHEINSTSNYSGCLNPELIHLRDQLNEILLAFGYLILSEVNMVEIKAHSQSTNILPNDFFFGTL